MPDFFTRPFNTIVRLCTVLLIGTIALKTVVMTSEVSLLMYFAKREKE